MRLSVIVCLGLAVALAGAEPEPHTPDHHYPLHPYHHPHHHLKGNGVAVHPGGGTSFVAPRLHLGKRSAEPEPEAEADADPSRSYSYVHHGYHPHVHYPRYHGYRYGHYYGYPAHYVHRRSAD